MITDLTDLRLLESLLRKLLKRRNTGVRHRPGGWVRIDEIHRGMEICYQKRNEQVPAFGDILHTLKVMAKRGIIAESPSLNFRIKSSKYRKEMLGKLLDII